MNPIKPIISTGTKRVLPARVKELYKYKKTIQELEFQIEALEQEKSYIPRPNDRAIHEITLQIQKCVEKINLMKECIAQVLRMGRF